MKSFSIRKANNPNQHKGATAMADVADDSMKYGYVTGNSKTNAAAGNTDQPQSLLTQEEQEQLKPKDVKVENPWIYEQTHQEYLENIKGLPARHANVIKKHHEVQKDQTFLHKAETGIDKDLATKEAIALLEKEYEIFNEPNMPGVRVLTRYDCWDEEKSIEEWMEEFKSNPGQAHGLSPIYQDYDYCWKPVEVLDYDYKEKKFLVKVCATGQEKYVTRLSLLFFNEDPEKFKQRVNECKQRQEIVEAELRFTSLVDSVPTDSVSTLSKERRFFFLHKSVRPSEQFDADKVYPTFKNLLRVVEEEYIRQMKKCIVLKQMEDTSNHEKFQRMKIPIRLSKKTSPYFGVVRCPKYNFSYNYEEVQNAHFSSDEDLVAMTRVFIQKCIDFQDQRFMNTNKQLLKLPRELKDLEKMQNSHHSAVSQNMIVQWRDYLIGEIQDKLRKNNHNFFEANSEVYERSPLKRIITRFEYILNSYLRDFVSLSISDFVQFIQRFTDPREQQNELWNVSNQPLIIIHLSILKKAKKDKKDKKEKKKEGKGEDGEEKVEDDEDDKNRIIYKPNIEECKAFILNSMDMIIKSTNNINDLESDLMPFLQKQGFSNFKIDQEFPWIKEAVGKLSQLIEDNVGMPNQLLKDYKEFEYIMNVDRKEMIDNLFKSGPNKDEKVPLAEIKEQVRHYDDAFYKIMTLSEDDVKFKLFSVSTQKMKNELAEQANKCKERILEATYNFCLSTIKDCQKQYQELITNIMKDPVNEQEFVDTKSWHSKAAGEMERLQNIIKDVYKHLLMLDEFSYRYQDAHIEQFWFLKIFPLRVQVALQEGKQIILDKTDHFQNNLQKEQEKFAKDLETYTAQVADIKLLNSIKTAQDYYNQAEEVQNSLDEAVMKRKEFNRREDILSQDITPYNDLDSLIADFKPFYELTLMASEIKTNFLEWTTGQLMKQDTQLIKTSVAQWQLQCNSLRKQFDNEDYGDASEVTFNLRTEQIDKFARYLPLVMCITSPAVTDEDWDEITQVLLQDEKIQREKGEGGKVDRNEVKIEDIDKYNLFQFMEEIDDITNKAIKKDSLAQKLKQMKEEMKNFEIEQRDYKSTKLIGGWDDINLKLDDQIVNVQAMNGSSFMKGSLKREAKNWEKKLIDMSELMDKMLKTQRNWMYLEPIFSSGDIAQTMPLEYKMFVDVDNHWKSTMNMITDDPGIIDLVEKENIAKQFDDNNKNLDLIQKKLNDFLEQKRLIFARFFFLANDDLLQILAQTKNPRLVQAHMDKCFEGISKVIFNDKDHVLGMISAEKEEVGFLTPIDVNEGDRKGNVENWMLDIESQMIKSLKKLTKDSLLQYPSTPRTDWSKAWPGQVVLAVSQVYWTKEVEDSITKGKMKDYIQKQRDQIEGIVQMVRGQLKVMERITLKALTVIDVHARDVVQQLIDLKVDNIADFEWSSQLRYYWEDKDVLMVKMVTAKIPYAYEYLGNSPRLVITALTDRCYRTLLGAKYLNYGGAPEGPAGTGKTESVKDLAKAIAVQCVVFNCSDGLDYLSMAKFFKGLAQSGAWCCFDEFNRIELEVLSVIAQQIQQIQNAIKNPKIRTFAFEKTELKINRACAVNITMNPGYAGRSELPDNLKALFRPCAMMVPDYALIAQIELFSFGFSDAAPLSVKVVASLRLSSEQLSSQFHYDFGMRAVKSILNACGRQRMILQDWEEDKICLKSLNDVNIPKFTQNDIPLFRGITSDLFPGVVLPEQDYKKLNEMMVESCKRNNIQPKEYFLEKCIQLYETLMVRHGLMVVGDPYAGKSTCINTLKEAMSTIKDDPEFVNVETHFVNPKAITQNQLYGVFDIDTQEWSDGVLAIKVRDCAESETPDRKWICFDGPVDAVWIENMNTVLDDNKKLCLTSGQIIKLKPCMTIMFQVDDLSQASPATISRCGMVLMESSQLGHGPWITSYCTKLKQLLRSNKVGDHVESLFHYIMDLSVEFCRHNGKFSCAGNSPFLVNHVIRLIETYMQEYKPKFTDQEEIVIPNDIEEKVNNALLFGIIWGIGGVLDEFTRSKFELFLREMIDGEDVRVKYELDMGPDAEKNYPLTKIPNKIGGDFKSLFDLVFIQQDMKWISWLQTVEKYQIDKDANYLQLSIPTIDTIRMVAITDMLLKSKQHCLLVGFTGTGKSVQVNKLLKEKFQNDEWIYYQLGFSAQTTSQQTQTIIDGSMEKRRKGILGPEAGKNGVIFVDDLNMPQREKYGAQPPIELLRQWMDYNGWYNINSPEREFTKIEGVRFVGAMGPPGSGRNSISSRYIRHFNVLYIEPYSKDSLKNIFSTIMDWLFLSKSNPPFPQAVQSMKDSLVLNTILIYNKVQQAFKPTPAKSHYTYNLRDVSKVFQGIAKSSGKGIIKEDDMLKLWSHECLRVFQDRLINVDDRDQFQTILSGIIKEKYKKDWNNLVTVEPLVFGSFVPMCYPNNDTTQKPYKDVYCELWDKEKLVKACEYQLSDFNSMNSQKKMNLVLFEAAIEHCAKITRIITTQFGHALLMGVGGSGRKSLTALAIHIALFESFEIEITKAYDFKEWRANMKNQLFYYCGVEEKQMVFVLNDTQIIIEAFLEDINNILNNGEIPNLYKDKEDEGMIIEAMRDNPINKNKGENEIMNDFLNTCKENIHIVLAVSPIGDDIKRRLRMFPSLVNCCAINYFLPWPQQALHSVAMTFLKEIPDLKQINGIVDICVDMQTRVTNLAVQYYKEYKRHYYVTPTSYLVLIKAFQDLLAKKRLQIDTVITKYDKGIQQLADAKEQVGILEAELVKMLPELEQAKKATAEKIILVQEKKKEVASKTEVVKKEEAIAQEILQRAEAMKKDADFEVQRVMPIYHLAIRAVSQLKRDDVVELKGFKTATKPVALVCETLIIIFNLERKIIYAGVGKDKHPEIWETAKKHLLTNELLNNCKNYPKDNIQSTVVEKLRPMLESPEYEDRVLKNASNAAWGLGKWVRAMVQYDDAMKIVKPKRAEAEKAKGEAAEAQAMWDTAVDKLRAVEAEMKQLVSELEETEARKKYLQDEYETAEKKLERANALISKLKDEEKNWEKSLLQNKEFKKCLVGDIIISSGIIAYLGVFSADYRTNAIKSWMELMNSFEIQSTDNFSLQVVLGDNVKIQRWHVDQLPQEQVAIDNGIIMENSDRWPIMIDPQTQGNIWIKSKEAGEGDHHLYVIKPTTETKHVSRILENTIRFGYPLLLEDANETFDPLLEPLLAKNIIKNRGMWQIKLGEGTIEYDKNFKFYITTKLSAPHYAPEVCVKVTMLNFMVTEDGLQDQMLNEVVKHEDPKKMEQKNKIQIEQAEDNKKKAELEDLILELIANNQKNLLEDDQLIESLDDSKAQCTAIDQKAEDAKITIDAINNMRKHFEQVGRRVSRMFFVLIQIMNVNSMYQYSLRFFKDIFIQAMKNGESIEKGKKNERKNFFMREFVHLLYINICRSLFEADKLLFSFLLCLKIMDETEGTLNHKEVRFLMQGGTRVEMSKPNPTGEGGWMTDKTWASVLQIGEEFECFKGLDENIEINLSHWERIYNSSNPQDEVENWPEPYNELSLMRQGMLLRILRPDKVVPIVQALVSSEKELGKEFIQPPAFDLSKSYKDSFNDKPIIIVLSPGADPMSEIQKLAMANQARTHPISLGQGQAQIAKDSIQAAMENGQTWVVLQNCHLSPSFMPILDAIIEKIKREPENKFRIWMTAMPCKHIPVNILQNGVKLTIEPPKGLKNNIMNSYAIMDAKEFDNFEKEVPFKCLMWGLCFFNAMILERRKYGPLGWNIPYQFSNSDLLISQAQLQDFLINYKEIPWVALKYMVAEANYGGRVTDPNDRVTINLILDDFYNENMLKKNHKLSASGTYFVPDVGDLLSYKEFIRDNLPINDMTEIFGLHENAEITSAINTTTEMLGIALTLQGGSSSGGEGKSTEDVISSTAQEILDKLPKNFDMEYVAKKHKLCYEDSMNTVLQQELLRYNNLVGTVRTSLVNVGKAIKGEVPMSPELENVCDSLFHNLIPELWAKVSYPSLKPLASYVVDMLERLKFMQNWIDNGAPSNFWLSGFFFTQSFLTGAKQNFARKYVIAIDHIDFDFQIISDESKYDLANGPEDGVYVYGLYVEGARWDDNLEAIEESHPKVLFSQMRPIWILPKDMKDIDYGHSFKCPVYKTARRAGTLSTTGHSTNFVLYIYLPIQEKHQPKHWIKRGVALLTQLSD